MIGTEDSVASLSHMSTLAPGRANPRTAPGQPLRDSSTAAAPSST